MKKNVLVLVALALISLARAGLAQLTPPDIIILGLNDISVVAVFNSISGMLEGSGSDAFRVKIWLAGAISGSVNITGATCPVTKQTANGSAVGYLSAFLSRSDLILPSPSTTDVVLTVEMKVPLTVPAGAYTGGAVQITATANF